MHAIDKEIMICCFHAICPKIDLSKKPSLRIIWKCPECGKEFIQKTHIKKDISLLALSKLINAYEANLEC